MKSFFRKLWLIISLLFLLLFGFIYSYFSEGIILKIFTNDPSTTLSFLESSGSFAAIIFIFLVILEVVFAPIPPLALYVVAGVLFGGFLGGILTLFGNILGAIIDFKIARKYGQKKIESRIDKKIKLKFDTFFEKYGPLSIFILRLNPLTTSDIVSYLAGLTKIKTFKFILATFFGLIPIIFLQTYLGDLFSKNPLLVGFALFFSLIYFIIFIYLIILALNSKK